ncbi:MAG: hypothetical protein K2O15_10395 [Lachnospiraceae bacterium]|nr:hypothetical protein [Lachnospiraceae bacterium]
MTDSEKLDLLLVKVTGLDEKVTDLDEKVTGLDEKVTDLDQKVMGLEKDMLDVKVDLRRLRRDADFIIDEVERVHGILDKHKEDKTVHTA